MKILVLGSGAGGGFPQWNCNCRLCAGQRAGRIRASPRTQSSIAVSADGERWLLLNASPDLGAQLRASPALWPRHGLRHSPIEAVVLMDSQIDHVTGLLSLREGSTLQLYCTPETHEDLSSSLPLLKALQNYCGVSWHAMPLAPHGDAWHEVAGLRMRALPVPGKAPPYSPRRQAAAAGHNAAVQIEDPASGRRLLYAPGMAQVGDAERGYLDACDCVLIDGTFWTEDEMVAAGLGRKLAADMGHLPQCDGPRGPGMLRALDGCAARRKVLIHINNSNPILDEDGPQRAELARRGIEVAFDGMELEV
ncbi:MULTISPECIES: pyrroloquinoline quinone biosynthesis protein PqqB [Variovorax]|uniref:pyrroloquinoline quinone biosynthesis protein PqqB n=1 Tax=Variovorax TaxID=34072 RepID=UPI00119B3CB1|nr:MULTISPECIES: pyrroloquinoline quinone biosynthesis protein PqqB [Variovorax]MBB3641755.1 pyrroloquinoline quinone biosynthesis protein B [Variovorax sp. BK613]MDR6520778.1 pyrroloquinoline quinone biosynthesis protein B [Variovorax paradoxus]